MFASRSLVPILQLIEVTNKQVQAIILVPTRQRAQQVHQSLAILAEHMDVKSLVVEGGHDIRQQVETLMEDCHIVVGHPGRVYDMINRRALKTDAIKMVCIAEADEMVLADMQSQLDYIFELLPPLTQVALFAEVMDDAVVQLTEKLMRDPLRIVVV